MNIYRFIILTVAIFCCGISLWSCTVTKNININSATKIVYRFQDASIPPQYHRSYTITVTKDQINLAVDIYDTVIKEATYDLPDPTMQDLLGFLKMFQVTEKEPGRAAKECTGGTSKLLTVYSNEKVLLKGIAYHCAGRVEGSLSGDIDAFTGKMEELIPDFANKLK